MISRYSHLTVQGEELGPPWFIAVSPLVPGAPGPAGGGAAHPVLPAEDEPALHRGQHDDAAHQHGRQGAGPHDRMGQEGPRLELSQ